MTSKTQLAGHLKERQKELAAAMAAHRKVVKRIDELTKKEASNGEETS